MAGRLFAVTIDNQTYALNAASGEVLWSHRGINETAGLMSSASPAVTGDTVIVPYSSGEIYALSVTDGKEIWSDSFSPASIRRPPPFSPASAATRWSMAAPFSPSAAAA